jgi:hypothetical protein
MANKLPDIVSILSISTRPFSFEGSLPLHYQIEDQHDRREDTRPGPTPDSYDLRTPSTRPRPS